MDPERGPHDDDRLRLRDVAPLLAGMMSSLTALAGLNAVLGYQVYDLTGSKLDIGLLGLAEFLPAALLVFVTGSVADHFERRRVAAAGMAVQAATVAAMAWYAATDPTSATPIFGLVIASGTARAFSWPAMRAMPADTVSAAQLPWLTARYAVMVQAGFVTGPVLGGLLYAVDPMLAFGVFTGLLVVAAVAVSTVRPISQGRRVRDTPDDILAEAKLDAASEELGRDAAPEKGAILHDALEGVRFVWRHPILLGAISLDLFAVLFGGAIALLPVIATDRLDVGAVGFGWLRAATGIGAGAMAIFLVRRPLQRKVGHTLLIAVALFGVFTIVLGITTSFIVAFVALVALSAADAISMFVRSSLVPLVTPKDKRGRVLAVETVFIGASNELGAFESGVTAQLLGAPVAIVVGGVATLAIAGGWWTLFPALRDVDRFPTAQPDVEPDPTNPSNSVR